MSCSSRNKGEHAFDDAASTIHLSLDYGAGMCSTTAGVGTTFRVQAVDAYGNLKTDSSDVFSYAINGRGPHPSTRQLDLSRFWVYNPLLLSCTCPYLSRFCHRNPEATQIVLQKKVLKLSQRSDVCEALMNGVDYASMTAQSGGIYQASYNISVAGTLTVSASFRGVGVSPQTALPAPCVVAPGPFSYFTPEGVGVKSSDEAIAGESQSIVLKAYDFFGNLASAESSGTFILEITINGATQQVAGAHTRPLFGETSTVCVLKSPLQWASEPPYIAGT